MDSHVVWSNLTSDVLDGVNAIVSQFTSILEKYIGLIFFLDIANSWMSALSVYQDLGPDPKSFSRQHPFACWVSVVINFFAGRITANFLLGEPILGFLNNPVQLRNIYVLTFVWWFVFHFPRGDKIVSFFPVRLVLSSLKEVYRSHKIYSGVMQVSEMYRKDPSNHLLMVVIGTVRGNGAGFMRIVERLVRGVWIPEMELLKPTATTKLALVASIIFVLNYKTRITGLPDSTVKFITAIVFVCFKIATMLLGPFDPFVTAEKIFSNIFLGGLGSPERVKPKKKAE